MRIDIITLFPEIFNALETSIPGRSQKAGAMQIKTHALRDFAINKHGQVDDIPYGGESGMVLRPEPLKDCLDKVFAEVAPQKPHVLLMSAQGKIFDQAMAKSLAKMENILIICGHYKGVDQRISDLYVQEEISIGDYVLTGGEFPAMVIVDAVCRLLPGVLGDSSSAETDSFYEPNLLGWPVYTRPQMFEGLAVPEVLLSGHHENIRKWRDEAALKQTREKRPDLYEKLLKEKTNRVKG